MHSNDILIVHSNLRAYKIDYLVPSHIGTTKEAWFDTHTFKHMCSLCLKAFIGIEVSHTFQYYDEFAILKQIEVSCSKDLGYFFQLCSHSLHLHTLCSIIIHTYHTCINKAPNLIKYCDTIPAKEPFQVCQRDHSK